MRDISKIRAAAERSRWIGSMVTNARDATIIEQYASELEERASELAKPAGVGPRVFWPHPGFAEAQLSMLRENLKNVFPPDPPDTPRFDRVLKELEEAEERRK